MIALIFALCLVSPILSFPVTEEVVAISSRRPELEVTSALPVVAQTESAIKTPAEEPAKPEQPENKNPAPEQTAEQPAPPQQETKIAELTTQRPIAVELSSEASESQPVSVAAPVSEQPKEELKPELSTPLSYHHHPDHSEKPSEKPVAAIEELTTLRPIQILPESSAAPLPEQKIHEISSVAPAIIVEQVSTRKAETF